MNNIIIKDDIKIEDLIYEVRGKQVMLDSDLAKLYKCANGTKTINLAVKRHINRFPERFCFRLKKEEALKIFSRFQSETLNNTTDLRGSNIKYLPYVFTEQGIAMLSAVLKTEIAEEISIKIMDAFVNMRKYIASSNYGNRISNLETKLVDHDTKIDLILDKLDNKAVNNHIFFEGQIYDAYSLMMDIFNEAKESINIIDNYAGKELFDLLRKIAIPISVYSKNFDSKLIKKYKSQYSNISCYFNSGFHDRFIILDKKLLYHCGSSFKDLGKKCFAITLLEDKSILNNILEYLKEVKNE